MALGVGNLALGYLAGSLSTLSPCVLPLLPILLGGALQQHRFGALALAAGLSASFTVVGLFAASLGFSAGIDPASLRIGAAFLMALFGAILLNARLYAAFVRLMTPLTGGANGLLACISGNGLGGQFLLGALLGAVWSPCAGPTLGAAIGLAAQSESLAQAGAVMLVFSLGAATPLLVLAYGSRRALVSRKERLAQFASRAKPIMGAALLFMGAFIASGFDKIVEARLTNTMPSWLVDLTTRF